MLLAAIFLGPWPVRAAMQQPTPDPNTLIGIGAVMRIDAGMATIGEIMKGGPADLDGHLKVNDQIAGVAQGDSSFVDCTNKDLADVVALIRGKKGTTVRLSVIPAAAGDPTKREIISIVRAPITVPPEGPVILGAGEGLQIAPQGNLIFNGPLQVVRNIQIAPQGNLIVNGAQPGVLNVLPGGGNPAMPAAAPQAPAPKIAAAPQAAKASAAPTPKAPKYAPDVEAKLAEFEAKVADIDRKSLWVYMRKKIDEVAEATGLDETGRKALGTAAVEAVEQSLKSSGVRMDDLLRSEMPEGQNLASMLAQMDAEAGEEAKFFQLYVGDWPVDHPAWVEGLKNTLAPAQMAAWQAAEAKRNGEVEQEIGKYLQGLTGFAKQQAQAPLKVKVSRLQADLDPPKDLVDKLKALADSVAAIHGERMRALAEKGLLDMDDDQRHDVIAQQNSYYEWVDIEALVRGRDDPDWDQGIAKLLPADDLKRAETMRQNRLDMRATAVGKLLVGLLDQKIALTGDQRQKLEPIVKHLVLNDPAMLEDRDPNNFYSYTPGTFFAVAAAAPDDEIQPILDPIQWKHWKDLSALKDADNTMNQVMPLALPAADGTPNPEPAAEPDEVERAVSKFLSEKSGAEREKVVGERVLKAEDIARTVQLAPDVAERLETAARGDAEVVMLAWNDAAEQMVRSGLSDASPDTVKQRLASIQPYQFLNLRQQMNINGPRTDSIWDKTVKSALSPDQMKAWQQQTDARSAYMNDAIAGYVVSQFDQGIGLAPEKWQKLEPMVAKIIKDYGVELGNFFANNGSGGWYLQNNYSLLPIAGISDDDLKTILSGAQFDLWKSSDSCGTATSYWSNIRQLHDQKAQVVKRRVKIKP